MKNPMLLNSLTEGDFHPGHLLRQSLTEGDFRTLQSGAFLIFRGAGHVGRIDWNNPVHAAYAPGQTTLPDHLTHPPDSDTFYAARAVSSTGKRERGTASIVRLRRLPDGTQHAAPHPVQALQIKHIAERTVRLSWLYTPTAEADEPDHFAVFTDHGTGTMDWSDPIGTVPYRRASLFTFDATLDESSDTGRFAVRTVGKQSQTDNNQKTVTITLREPTLPQPTAVQIKT